VKSDLTHVDVNAIKGLKLKVEDNSHVIDDIVTDIILPYTRDLDNYVTFIKECLKDGENPPTDYELEDFCMNLSAYIYFASGMCEQLGIRDDIAKAVYKEAYNNARDNIQSGTVQDKNVQAELMTQQESIISSCYTRAYKSVKAKIESAQELLSSCKKILSNHMTEKELTKMAPSTGSRRREYES
jgi:hypothetical protein